MYGVLIQKQSPKAKHVSKGIHPGFSVQRSDAIIAFYFVYMWESHARHRASKGNQSNLFCTKGNEQKHNLMCSGVTARDIGTCNLQSRVTDNEEPTSRNQRSLYNTTFSERSYIRKLSLFLAITRGSRFNFAPWKIFRLRIKCFHGVIYWRLTTL